MAAVRQLTLENSRANKKVADCLSDLMKSYPLAKAYPRKIALSRQLMSDKYCFREAAALLDKVHRRTENEVELARQRVGKLVLSTEAIRKKNAIKLAGLQRQTNAAEGAEGLYDDVVLMNNTRLLQLLFLMAGSSALFAISYLNQ